MTDDKENDLKAIYKDGGLENYMINKAISEKHHIAAVSVSEMLGKLKQEDY